ncbi:MAG: hypothetical protein HWN66_18805 [Candidatus Helarchaeota archaeon]|nr:hypothetical protein [Candidatus Helarchaeota archaeon]
MVRDLGKNKRIWCVFFILVFGGSLISGFYAVNLCKASENSVNQLETSELLNTNDISKPIEYSSQNNYSLSGQDQAETLLAFLGASYQDSNTEEDLEITSHNWNVSNILVNFTDIHLEKSFSVENQTPAADYVTIFNSSAGQIVNYYAMEFDLSEEAFLHRLNVYLRYSGNFSVIAIIYGGGGNLGYPIPPTLPSEYMAISETKNLTTQGTNNETEWVEFNFKPRSDKAYLNNADVAYDAFFVVLHMVPSEDSVGEIYLQWGYNLDTGANPDDGLAFEYKGNTWQVILVGMGGTVDLLLKNISYSSLTYSNDFDIETDGPENYVKVFDNAILDAPTQLNAQQFQPAVSAYLQELDVFLLYRGEFTLYAEIYNAREDSFLNPGEAVPNELLITSAPVIVTSGVIGTASGWINFPFLKKEASGSSFLDRYNTFNNSFFVVIRAFRILTPTVDPMVYWGCTYDTTNGDAGFAYFWYESFGKWVLFEYNPEIGGNIDLLLRDVTFISYEINATAVGLEVNSTVVEDYIPIEFGGSVYLTGFYDGSGGVILLNTSTSLGQTVYYSALWGCIFSNQTYASTAFTGYSLGEWIDWNVTLGTNFPSWDSETQGVGGYLFQQITIIFPIDHSIRRVNLDKVPYILWNTTINASKQYLVILGANGNWRIEALSPNYIEEIHTYNGTIEVRQFYVGDMMNVTAKVNSGINGSINLTIYDLYDQIVNTSLSTPVGNWTKYPPWPIQENGTHNALVFWSNGTEVGIRSTSVMCVYHTNLSVINTNIVAPFQPSDTIYIDVNYTDLDNNEGIPQADISVNITEGFWWVTEDLVNVGVYNVSITPSVLENGNYTVQIVATRDGYNSSTVFVDFEIYSTTNATLDVVGGCRNVTGEWWIDPDPFFDDQTHSVTVLYANGTFPYEGIQFAQIVAEPNWTSTPWFGSPTNITPGFYDISFDSEGLHEGDIGLVTIAAYSQYFETKIVEIYVNITEIPSNYLSIDAGQYSTMTAYEGETIDFAVGYWDGFHENPIIFENPTVGNLTWQIEGTNASGIMEKSVWQYEASISLPDEEILGTQTYNITVIATAARDYATTETNLTLNVLSKENTSLMLISWTATEYRVGHSFTLNATLTFENGTALSDEWIEFNILRYFNSSLKENSTQPRQTGIDGVATYEYSDIPEDTDQINISVTYIGTEQIDPAKDNLTLEIAPKYNATLTLLSELPDEIMIDDTLEIEALFVYENTSIGIEDATIEFVLFHEQTIILSQEIQTDEDGHALVVFEISSDDFSDFETFKVRIRYYESSTINYAEYTAEASIEVMTWGKLILRFLPYIIIVAVAVVATYLSYRQFVAVPRRKRRLTRMEKMAGKFTDIANLQHLLVVHSDAGTCIYQHSFGEVTFDADLISGFLTAIAAFQTELTLPSTKKVPFGEKKLPEVAEKKGFELSYADFKILLQDGKLIRTALILATSPTESLRGLLSEFVEQFETKFEADLKSWKGAMAPFQRAADLVEQTFETSLLWPHAVEPVKDDMIKNLNSLESSLVTLASSIQEEKKYFFLSALVIKAQRIRRESQVEILGTINELRQKGLLKALPIEKMQERIQRIQRQLDNL